jgi:hypothetical protein
MVMGEKIQHNIYNRYDRKSLPIAEHWYNAHPVDGPTEIAPQDVMYAHAPSAAGLVILNALSSNGKLESHR